MFKFYFTLIIIVISGIYNYSLAQSDEKVSEQEADVITDYNAALAKYLELYKNNKEDLEINYNIGYCYLQINDDKSKAIPYLEFVYNQGRYKEDVLLNLGLAYMYAYKFDDAISFFEDYRTVISSKKAELIANYYDDLQSGKVDYQKKITTGKFSLVDHYIENCESAKELLKLPVNVTFENLGKEVNSKHADFFPFITKNQEKLYFSSRREENPLKVKNPQGYFTSDIYVSEVKDGKWTTPQNMGPVVNSIEDEHCVYVEPGGKKMIIFQDNENVTGDIFLVPLQELQQTPPVNFEQPVNTDYREFEACITDDEHLLIISSDREGGFGETDLYMFHKLASGKWGTPINLGRQVNSKYKEAFPMFDRENNVLYFASEGHTNMGGFDIFKSEFNPETQKFGLAENIGYPINTPEDDMVFSLANNKRDGYISAVIKGGFGDLDIYKVVFNEIENRPTILKGIVSLSDLAKEIIEINNTTVSITDTKTNKVVDSKKVNPKTGRYVFAIEPGQYLLKATSENYIEFQEIINVYDKSDYVFEIEKNLLLQKAVTDTSGSGNGIANGGLTKPLKVIIRGAVTTNDSLQTHIDAFVSILDAKTRNKLEGKSANPQTGKYFFALYPGTYILVVSSFGFADFEREITVEANSDNKSEAEKK